MSTDGQNRLISVGYNGDVVSGILSCYEQYKNTPDDILQDIKQSDLTIDGKCQSVFAYMVDNVRYELDPSGYQLIKSPARLLEDGRGDCKSLTMFLVCCLHCLGISHIIRFVSFDRQKQYTHVYAVALDEQGNEIILDACETDPEGRSIYDFARPYTYKKDFYFYE